MYTTLCDLVSFFSSTPTYTRNLPLIFSSKADLINLNVISTRHFSGSAKNISNEIFIPLQTTELLWEGAEEIMFYVAKKFPVYESECLSTLTQFAPLCKALTRRSTIC